MSMPENSVTSSARNSAPYQSSFAKSCGMSKPAMLKEGELNLMGVAKSKYFEGDSNAEGASVGENFGIGVEVIPLVKFVLEISPRILGDLTWSSRDLFVGRFSGELVPGTFKRPELVSAKISNSVLISVNDAASTCGSRLNAGLHGRFSSRSVKPRSGEPTSWRTLSRCIRRLVFGDTDGGGLVGAFSLTAGVRGGSIWEES